MTIDLVDRRAVPEAGRLPEALAFKVAAADDDPTSGQTLGVDEAEGTVTAIVSVTGVKDDVDDIIIPGAYRQTLTKRRPKVCWAHAWEHPIGRVLHIEELMPGDKRLPAKQRNGQPWPKEAGALVAVMQFNLRSDEGKQAFEAVRFYSETGECEWSIGYNVPPGGATKDKQGIRHIKSLDLYELSVVLFGAHSMTGTLSIKQAIATIRTKTGTVSGLDLAMLLAAESKALGDTGGAMPPAKQSDDPNAPDAQAAAATDGSDQPDEEPDAQPEEPGDDDEGDAPDFSDGVMVAVYPDPAAADAVANHISGPDETTPKEDLHVTLAYLGKVGDLSVSETDLNNMVEGAIEDSPVLTGQIGGIGTFPDSGDGAPTWAPVDVPGLSLLREQIVGALGDLVYTDHGFAPHMTLGYNIGMIDPVPDTPVTFDRISVVYGNSRRDYTLERQPGNTDGTKGAINGPDAWYLRQETGEGDQFAEAKVKMDTATRKRKPTIFGSDTAWPIGNVADLEAALKRFNAMKNGDKDKAKVKRWIIKRARELDALSKLPDDWNITKSLAAYDPDYDEPFTEGKEVWFVRGDGYAVKAEGGADRNRGGAERLRHYWTRGPGAAKIAWGTPGDFRRCFAELSKYMGDRAKGYCADRHKEVTGMWPGDKRNKSFDVPAGAKMFPNMPGSYQERIDLIRQAIGDLYEGQPLDEGQRRWYDLMAVYDDHCVFTVEVNSDGGDCDRQTFMAPYYLDDDDDAVKIGEPQEVQLEVIALPGDDDDDVDTDEDGARYETDQDVPLGDGMPYAETLDMLTASMKSVLVSTARRKMEGKAGRVLSGANERALRSAFQHLANVLAAAGIELDTVTPENPTPLANNTSTGTGSESDPRYTVDPRTDVETTSPDATIKAAPGTQRDDGTVVLDGTEFMKSLEAFEV